MATHEEKRKRREAMARAVEGGENLDAVGKRFRVTPTTVRRACRESGVKLPDGRERNVVSGLSGYAFIAEYLNGSPITKIADKHGVSRQCVQQVLAKLKKHGVDLVAMQRLQRKAKAAEATLKRFEERTLELHASSYFTYEDLGDILRRYSRGDKLANIADDYGCNRVRMSQIVGHFAQDERTPGPGTRNRKCPICGTPCTEAAK